MHRLLHILKANPAALYLPWLLSVKQLQAQLWYCHEAIFFLYQNTTNITTHKTNHQLWTLT